MVLQQRHQAILVQGHLLIGWLHRHLKLHKYRFNCEIQIFYHLRTLYVDFGCLTGGYYAVFPRRYHHLIASGMVDKGAGYFLAIRIENIHFSTHPCFTGTAQ